jgi:hypothetical protein
MILPTGANQPHRIKAEWPVSSKSQGGSGRNTGSATIIPLPLPGDEAGRVEAGIEGLALHLTNALIELASIAEAHRVDISDAARLAAELLNVGVMGLTPISMRLLSTPAVGRNVRVDAGMPPLVAGVMALTGRRVSEWTAWTLDRRLSARQDSLGLAPAVNHTIMHHSDVSSPQGA